MKILLMEDDPVLGDIIADYLEQHYTTVDRVFDSAEAQQCIDRQRYDLFIFDINVPGKSGIELIEELRSFNDTTPAIIITAYEDTAHLKAGFDAGAHDYIRKPFELEELRLRIEKSKALFGIEQETPVKIDEERTYYPKSHTLRTDTGTVQLKPKEAQMLEYFIAHAGRLISNEELVQNLWEFEQLPSDATLRSYIRNLREHIGADKIITQRGMGYRYE